MIKRRVIAFWIIAVIFLTSVIIAVTHYNVNKDSNQLSLWMFISVMSLFFLCGKGLILVSLWLKGSKK
ncbi:hypothetical protein [Paenibacillus ihumii]|uniref:hypothetical protein n=1 Tax=Paenibacillus ihumii TaxID=687436 RepID=UPI0006D7FFD2|nr:hypothetical protein [Paenibacillus ihumii]